MVVLDGNFALGCGPGTDYTKKHISIYARTNRCYNERSFRTNYVHSSISHCTRNISILHCYVSLRSKLQTQFSTAPVSLWIQPSAEQVYCSIHRNKRHTSSQGRMLWWQCWLLQLLALLRPVLSEWGTRTEGQWVSLHLQKIQCRFANALGPTLTDERYCLTVWSGVKTKRFLMSNPTDPSPVSIRLFILQSAHMRSFTQYTQQKPSVYLSRTIALSFPPLFRFIVDSLISLECHCNIPWWNNLHQDILNRPTQSPSTGGKKDRRRLLQVYSTRLALLRSEVEADTYQAPWVSTGNTSYGPPIQSNDFFFVTHSDAYTSITPSLRD
jgi:hypothetical protein